MSVFPLSSFLSDIHGLIQPRTQEFISRGLIHPNKDAGERMVNLIAKRLNETLELLPKGLAMKQISTLLTTLLLSGLFAWLGLPSLLPAMGMHLQGELKRA